ncbi:MAG: hypothetical protein PF637_07060 [Spirochaetes bacterium]|jgi:protein arginine kinase|nr:hypothetical protein [Spirochaetota bacterium]
MFKHLLDDTSFWSAEGQMSDVVLSSRLRLARNQASLDFPLKSDFTDHSSVEEPLLEFVNKSKYRENLKFYRMGELGEYDRRFLRERNIITEEMENNDLSALVFNTSQQFAIQVNSEDHFRIQVLRSGMDLYDAYRDIVEIDTELNLFVDYAFNDTYGYLSSSLDNAGTGLKASALLHLPVISALGTIVEVKKMAEEMGAAFTSVSGDQNQNYGSLYLIANKKAINQTETEIIEIVDDIVKMVAGLEMESRDDYSSDFKLQLEDKVWRSYGILKYSRSVTYVEALEYLSNIRLGIILFIIKDISLKTVHDLLVKIQTAHLLKLADRPLESLMDFDIYRSEYIRSVLE